MEELLQFAQTYKEILAVAGAAFLVLLLFTYLIRILRQIKRLNKSLRNISENIQAYVDVVLSEEEETEEQNDMAMARPETPHRREPEPYTQFSEEQKRIEDERLFNSVLQEYFS